MKKAFTLVEMLIVVVVLVTLMSITFRLTSLGDDQNRRNATIARLQRLENCLSGYYAAYGTYPPVRLHASRNYNLACAGGTGTVQDFNQERQLSLNWYKDSGNHGIGETEETRDWYQVRAACLAQPIAVRAPVQRGCNELIVALSTQAKETLEHGDDPYSKDDAHAELVRNGWDDGYTTDNGSRFSTHANDADWWKIQLFEFGVLSFLLPRYQFMMNGPTDNKFFKYAQWTANNALPADPLEAGRKFYGWEEVRMAAEAAQEQSGDYKKQLARIANIPSQAVCARWLPNLEASCYRLGGYCNTKFYGIDVYDDNQWMNGPESSVFAPLNGSSRDSGKQYMLGGLTILDGWGNELYYYSPSPHQSYTLWSSGKNGRTFPPWVPRESLSGSQNQCVSVWISDDIVHMSN